MLLFFPFYFLKLARCVSRGKVATLQEHLTQLTLELLRERTERYESRLSALEAKLSRLMANFDTAGKLSGFTPFEHIFIVKTRLNHAQLRGLPAVSNLDMSQVLRNVKQGLFFIEGLFLVRKRPHLNTKSPGARNEHRDIVYLLLLCLVHSLCGKQSVLDQWAG